MIFIFSSFTKLPLGDSTAILFSSPVIVMGLSVCLLKVSLLMNQVGVSIFVENPKVSMISLTVETFDGRNAAVFLEYLLQQH